MPESFERGAMTETTLCVLLALHEKNHGYGVIKAVEAMTGGRVVIPVGTLYPALNSMLARGLIEELEPAPPYQTRKKHYIITKKGHRAVIEELDRLCSLVRIGQEILLREKTADIKKLPDEVIEEQILNFKP